MSSQYQDELPDAISGMLMAFNTSIALYVAQYPDWEKFTHNAANIDVEDEDISEIYDASTEIIENLYKHPELSDPEVPKTIATIRQFLNFPARSSKRAAFAMIRTVENIVSAILRYSLELINKTAEKSVDSLSGAAAKIFPGLLGLALIGASGVGPAALRAGDPWVNQAAEIVKKQLDRLSE